MSLWTRSRVGRWLAALALAALVAGPAPAQAPAQDKNEDIEKAGEALKKGQVDEAYKLLQEAVRKKPDLPPARLMLARLFLASKEGHQQGRAFLEQAVAEHPDHPEVYLTCASLALGEGRVTETILNCQKALDLASAGRWTAEQKKHFQREARLGLAKAYESRRDWANARTHLAALVANESKNSELRTRLATALFFLDKPDEAFQELQNAVRDNPNLEPPTVTMGRLWTAKGDVKQAREWLDRAIKAEPNSIRVQLAYADWLLHQGDIDHAKDHVDAAAKLKPDDPEVLKAQGLMARTQKNLPAAEKLFRRILADAPGDFFASNQLALVLVDQNDKDQRSRAVQLAEVNARQYPRSPDALATLGYVSFRVGNIEEAGKALQASVAASGNQVAPDTAYYLALVFNDRGKTEEAIKFLEGALKAKGLFVYHQAAETLLATLKKKEPPKDKEKAKAP
jgi:uncharacterized protein (TIGR02996 family)